MGLKLAHALGAHVIAFTTSPDKAAEAQRLGADEVVISRDEDQMKAQAGRIDLIVNTVAAPHPLDPFLMTLKRDGTMVLVGAPPEPHPSPTVGLLVFKRRSLAGSLIGGIAETQEMLDFCAEHDIVSDIEMIDIKAIDDAYRRMAEGDVKYRFVIDNQSLAAPA
jgi:alcohol dehydrogenase (NADP+)